LEAQLAEAFAHETGGTDGALWEGRKLPVSVANAALETRFVQANGHRDSGQNGHSNHSRIFAEIGRRRLLRDSAVDPAR
jgi:hypothetical protein